MFLFTSLSFTFKIHHGEDAGHKVGPSSCSYNETGGVLQISLTHCTAGTLTTNRTSNISISSRGITSNEGSEDGPRLHVQGQAGTGDEKVCGMPLVTCLTVQQTSYQVILVREAVANCVHNLHLDFLGLFVFSQTTSSVPWPTAARSESEPKRLELYLRWSNLVFKASIMAPASPGCAVCFIH